MKNKVIRLIWQCNDCKSHNVSYSNQSHHMDWCECGNSAVDLEEHYQRNAGTIVELDRKMFVDGEWKNVT